MKEITVPHRKVGFLGVADKAVLAFELKQTNIFSLSKTLNSLCTKINYSQISNFVIK